MAKITCPKCGTFNDTDALEEREGRCRQCGRWIMTTTKQRREAAARRKAPPDRSAAARKAWKTRKLAGKATRTTAQKLDDARAKVEQWERAEANASAKVLEWRRKVRRLETRIKREESARPLLSIVRGDESSEASRTHRRYSAE